MKKLLICVLVVVLGASLASAQSPTPRQHAVNENAWLMYFGTHKFSDRWGVHLEGQWRRNGFTGENSQQLLLRTGLNYHFNAQVFATAGYCFVETYPYGGQPVRATFPEHRLWQQLQIRNQLGRVEWVNRLRLEQRWVQLPVFNESADRYEPGDAVYTNRVRLLNRFSVPLNGTTIADRTWYLTVYDEPMVNFGKNVGANFFDQNRAYAALGYRLPRVGRLEVGYLYQTVHKSDGVRVERNHTLQMGLSSNIDFYRGAR